MGAVSAVCGLFTGKVIFRSWSLVITLNCILGGLVAITASCSIVQPWAAFLIGTVAAWIYICGRMLLGFAHIDDPVDAFPVHGMCGVWGVIAVGIFADKGRMEDAYGEDKHFGWIYGGTGVLFGIQLIGVSCIISWCLFWGASLFGLMKITKFLRIPKEVEDAGVDKLEHGDTPAWPEFEMYTTTTTNPFLQAKEADAGDDDGEDDSGDEAFEDQDSEVGHRVVYDGEF